MFFRSTRLMHLCLCTGLVMLVSLLAGCGEGESTGGGSGETETGRDAGDGDRPGHDVTGGGDETSRDTHGGGDPLTGPSGNNGTVSINHGSPEALFDSMLDAARAQDYKAVAECYAPAIQREMAVGMLSMAATVDMNPVVRKEDLAPILERHGIAWSDLPAVGAQMQSQAEQLADGLADVTGFVGDMMSTIPDVAQGFTDTFGDAAVDATQLTDIQVDDDEASAQITAAGQENGPERRVTFVRIDGLWYVTD